MKKILFVMPLMAISLFASCNNGGGQDPVIYRNLKFVGTDCKMVDDIGGEIADKNFEDGETAHFTLLGKDETFTIPAGNAVELVYTTTREPFDGEYSYDELTGAISVKMTADVTIYARSESKNDYFCVTCNSDEGDLSYSKLELSTSEYQVDLEYSTDKEHWTQAPSVGSMDDPALIHHFTKGESLYLRGNNPNGWSLSNVKQTQFSTTSLSNEKMADFTLSGNIMSLISKDNYKTLKEIPDDYCFINLFLLCENITDARDLLLPATTLKNNCYYCMFTGCINLINTPNLPALELTEGCYYSMFSACESLVNAPKLIAETMEKECYRNMFGGCEALEKAPELPSRDLAEGCYQTMFQGCYALETAPFLPASTSELRKACYSSMFLDCTSLEYIEVGFGVSGMSDWPDSDNKTSGWLNNVATNGTFIWNGSNDGPTERTNSTVPESWSINPLLLFNY